VSPTVSRALTLLAAAVLAFDGAALLLLGWWSHRSTLSLVGGGFVLSCGLVLLYWRWYRRRLDEMTAVRQALSQEAREMQRLLSETDRH
jgi:membrane protein implicated in regulation of membrane protease activity